jgi:hypothetical protein
MQQRAENMRIDKAVLQMQYLLNAGLAHYVANGSWPGTANTPVTYSAAGVGGLQGSYVPNTAIPTPFTGYYTTVFYTSGSTNPPLNTFVVEMTVPGNSGHVTAIANMIAGRMPMATTTTSGSGVTVSAYVNIPGQNLNNAGAVNFAGLYHQGACVPVPSCPNVTTGGGVSTTPQVFIVPVSISGVNDQGSSNNVYPISSFTAYATQPAADPDACYSGSTGSPPDCAGTLPSGATPPPSGLFWRACLQVITERGNVQETRTDDWGSNVTLAAFVRCGIPNEPEGSDFTVFSH